MYKLRDRALKSHDDPTSSSSSISDDVSKSLKLKRSAADGKTKDAEDGLDELRILAGRTHLHRAQPAPRMSLRSDPVKGPASESVAFIDEVPENVAVEAELMWSELMAMVTDAKWSM